MKFLEILTDSESEDCHSQKKPNQNEKEIENENEKEDSSELIILTKTQYSDIQILENAEPIEISQNPVVIEHDTKKTEPIEIRVSNPEKQIRRKDPNIAKKTPLQLIRPQIIRNLESELKERQPLIQKRDFSGFKDNSEATKGSYSRSYILKYLKILMSV